MQSEMGERGIPIQNKERIHEIQNLFLKEYESKNLKSRIAINNHGKIVACAGGLLRLEYFAPLNEKQTLFGWAPPYRKNGLASQLVEEVCKWLKDRGVQEEPVYGLVLKEEEFTRG